MALYDACNNTGTVTTVRNICWKLTALGLLVRATNSTPYSYKVTFGFFQVGTGHISEAHTILLNILSRVNADPHSLIKCSTADWIFVYR